VTERRIAGAVFRADHPEHTDLSRTAEASRRQPGRFNTSHFGAVYLSCEPETAIQERRRSEGEVEHPCALFVVSLSVANVVDLSVDEELERWGLTGADLTSDDHARTQQVAESAFERGVEAMLWPSATGHGLSLAVFLARLAEQSTLDIIHQIELTPSVVSSVDAGVPIAAAHPLLSTFPRVKTAR
jgi:RES domain-containing protein